jgi:glycosyltransferase involved in cell wall biosynthesis
MSGVRNPVLIVIPAWNESQNIELVVSETLAAVPNADILVVDDGSTDDTAERARAAGALVISLPVNLGVGGAMRAGFKFARQFGYSRVVQVDGDGQHDPNFVPALLDQLDKHDIAIGARFAGKGDYEVGGPRKWAMSMLSVVLSAVCKTKLTDTTSGFKAMGPRAVELFSRRYPAEYLGDTIEALMIARHAGLSVTQVAVSMRVRANGNPSQSFTRSAVYLSRAAMALLIGLTRR